MTHLIINDVEQIPVAAAEGAAALRAYWGQKFAFQAHHAEQTARLLRSAGVPRLRGPPPLDWPAFLLTDSDL